MRPQICNSLSHNELFDVTNCDIKNAVKAVAMPDEKTLVRISPQVIERKIFVVRGQRVLLDFDLARLYGISTKTLNQGLKRNRDRFPEDFAYQLTKQEFTDLTSQIAISRIGRGGRRKRPWVFTEQGVAMLSSVLNSQVAISVNIQIIRTFVNLRRMITSRQEMWLRIDEMEKKYDKQFQVVFKAIKLLLDHKPKDDPGKRRF